MANEKSTTDKPFALRVIIACLAAIAIVYFLLAKFSHQIPGNFSNGVYVTGVVILSILFIAAAIWAYVGADGAYDNLSKGILIGITVVTLAWAMGWVAGSNEKVAPGSPQMEDAR